MHSVLLKGDARIFRTRNTLGRSCRQSSPCQRACAAHAPGHLKAVDVYACAMQCLRALQSVRDIEAAVARVRLSHALTGRPRKAPLAAWVDIEVPL